MSVSDINSKISEAISAQESGDYATAIIKLRSAQMLMAGMPDAGSDGEQLRWDRAAIDRMLSELQRQQSASGGLRFTKIKFKRASSCDE